jgi:hypothetical protein
MAVPGNYPLQLYRGDTNRWDFKLWEDPDKTTPTDLSGVLPKAEIRDKPSGATIIEMSTIVEGPNIIHMVLQPIQSLLVPAKAVWDLQLTLLNGDILTILRGDVNMTPDVTDSTVVLATSALRTAPTMRVVKNVVR